MADLADVETSLVGLLTAAIYPNGLTAPSSVGVDCRIYRGWPAPAGLDADLKAGKVNVTVFPDAAPGQTLTRYAAEWHGTPATPTLSVSTHGSIVTFGGTADIGQIAGILLGNANFAYRTVSGDTPASVAANLGTMIRTGQIVQVVGSTLTIPGAPEIVARVVADSPGLREVRRQSHEIRISFWCPTPNLRDSMASIVDTALAAMTFIDLPDTSVGRISYRNTAVFDQSQSAILYRRDLVYSVEYPTILSASLPSMLFGAMGLNALNVTL